MQPDSVSWARGVDRPLVVFKPDTEGGRFKGVLGTSVIVGDRLAVNGLSAEEVSAVFRGEVDVLSGKVRASADAAGTYVLHDCTASILNGRLRATGVSGTEIVEENG